jgi:hypothetical protein
MLFCETKPQRTHHQRKRPRDIPNRTRSSCSLATIYIFMTLLLVARTRAFQRASSWVPPSASLSTSFQRTNTVASRSRTLRVTTRRLLHWRPSSLPYTPSNHRTMLQAASSPTSSTGRTASSKSKTRPYRLVIVESPNKCGKWMTSLKQDTHQILLLTLAMLHRLPLLQATIAKILNQYATDNDLP